MNLKPLNDLAETEGNKSLQSSYHRFGALLQALADRDGPDDVADQINSEVERVNSLSGSTRDIRSGVGTALGNMAFIGAGIPIGLAIGVGIGTNLDRKAAAEGRQLDIDV